MLEPLHQEETEIYHFLVTMAKRLLGEGDLQGKLGKKSL